MKINCVGNFHTMDFEPGKSEKLTYSSHYTCSVLGNFYFFTFCGYVHFLSCVFLYMVWCIFLNSLFVLCRLAYIRKCWVKVGLSCDVHLVMSMGFWYGDATLRQDRWFWPRTGEWSHTVEWLEQFFEANGIMGEANTAKWCLTFITLISPSPYKLLRNLFAPWTRRKRLSKSWLLCHVQK